MKNLLPFLILFSTLGTSCQPLKEDQKEVSVEESPRIIIKHSGLFKNYTDEKLRIADFLENYFNLMYDSTLEVRNSNWDSKILSYRQDFFLKGSFEKEFFHHNPPKILGIRKLKSNSYEVKLEIEQDGFTFKIMNLLVAFDGLDRPYFIDQLGENLVEFEQGETGNLHFLYSKKTTKNDSLEQKMADFNQKTANLFLIPPKHPSIIVLKDLKDYSEVLGYDYMTFLTYDGQTGGIAMPNENILFSANNSPYYPHELVHLYTADHDAHQWFDEGLATYLGGSVEYSLEYHLEKVANAMDSLNFTILPNQEKLDDDTNTKYTLGGLFCKLAMEEYGGREALMKLLNSGKSEKNFHQALKAVFGIEQEEQADFIQKKLLPYRNKK
ncbi:MAG: hypothetical protein JKY48_18435 [Flavobacteriales bacterium]|nr:hypothetical protein [Flavobacteriales bacterium]